MGSKDIVYVSGTAAVVVFILLLQVLWIIPAVTTQYFLWYAVAAFIFSETAMNAVMILKTNTSIRGKMMPSILLPGWQYCFECQANRPPRAYHCHDCCKTCILKRDHHCSYLGKCIGYFNQRFFILLLFWGVLGCILATGNNITFYNKTVNHSIWLNIFFYFLPLLSYFTGMSGVTFLFASHYTLCFYTFGTCLALLIYQIMLIFRSQTVHEYRTNDFTYATNYGKFFRNMKSVFGDNILVTLLLPFKASPMESDGLYTAVTNDHGKSL